MGKVINFFLFLLIVVSSCELNNSPLEPGQISFVDYTDTEKILNGRVGLIDFGEKLVEMGDRSVKPMKIKSSGVESLVINNISIEGDGFGFVDDISPDFPLIIPAGKTINDIFIEFSPLTGGEFSGTLFVETEAGTSYFDLAGIGLWQLTLTVAGAGDDSRGTIISPIEVTSGNSGIVTSTTGIFDLACEIDFLYEFVAWTVAGTPDVVPIFETQNAKETTVELKSHTEISMEIRNPFARYPGPPNNYTSIQNAIDNCLGNSQIAVIVSEGTYAESFILAVDVPVYGGYNAVWGDRDYENRVSYQTIINGSISSGSGIGSNVILEGFVINGNVSFNSGTEAMLQYNTITGVGASPAVTIDNASNVIQNNIINGGGAGAESVPIFITNFAAPNILNNTITAGTTSGDYSKAYGIKVTESSKPVIYKNNINAGTAGGTGSQSFGIFNDFECEPLITGNTIFGGTASGTSGQSYGIYMINNGKVTAGYNNINGGAGKTAYGLYTAYGGNLYLDYNNIFTSGSSSTRHGVYIGAQGRVRRLLNSGLYDCPDSLMHTSFPGEDITDIEDVNDYFHTDTNTDSIISFTIPEDPNYE